MSKSANLALHVDHDSLSLVSEIEGLYDEFDRTRFELRKKELQGSAFSLWNLYSLLWDKNFSELFRECEKLLHQFTDPTIKAFIIQAAVAACEILFDLKLRKKWLRLWNQEDFFATSTYAQYLYYCHRGNTYYFEGNSTESIKYWNKGIELCKSIQYKRGIFRLQFFAGRAYDALGFFGQAHENYENALFLAESVNANRFYERIRLQINKGENGKQYLFNQNQFEIFDLIKSGKIKKAKKLSLFYCRCRRAEKRDWGAESEWILLAWIAAIEKKNNRFYRLLDFMDSENTKWIVLKSAEALVPEIKSFDKRFEHNLNLLKVNEFTIRAGSNSRLKIDSLDKETKDLIQLLKTNQEGLSKEAICLQLWNYNYDPSIHDPRIYVVISKVRRFYGSQKSVINSYGGLYKINSLLI